MISNYVEIITVYLYIYIFLDNGKVLKTVNAESADSIQRVTPVVIEELQVFPQNVSVRNLQIVRTDAMPEGRLIVVSDYEVLSLRLHRCDKVNSGCRYIHTYNIILIYCYYYSIHIYS